MHLIVYGNICFKTVQTCVISYQTAYEDRTVSDAACLRAWSDIHCHVLHQICYLGFSSSSSFSSCYCQTLNTNPYCSEEIVPLAAHPVSDCTTEVYHKLSPLNVGGSAPSLETCYLETDNLRTCHELLSSCLDSFGIVHPQSICIVPSSMLVKCPNLD